MGRGWREGEGEREGGWGEREGEERGRVREREGGWGEREGGERGRVRREGGRGGEGRVIHIVIGMFTSNPMIPQYLNNILT